MRSRKRLTGLPTREAKTWRLTRTSRIGNYGWHLRAVALALMLLCLPSLARQAHATLTCTAAGPTLSFGSINPSSGYPYSVSGFLVVTCNNNNTSPVEFAGCLSVGTGSGGTSSSNRTLASGANTIPVQIGITGAGTQAGDGTAYPMGGPQSGTVPASGSGTINIPLTVTMPDPGSIPQPGTYSSSFTGTDAKLYYKQVSSTPAACSTIIGGSPSTTTANFVINATVTAQCSVTATSMNFPARSLLTAAVTTTATVTTTCNSSVAVTVALDNGASGTGPTARHMSSGANNITYGLYRDSGLTQPWGSTAGTDTASAANGSATFTVYGKVPVQTSPAPGAYSDVVNVIITY